VQSKAGRAVQGDARLQQRQRRKAWLCVDRAKRRLCVWEKGRGEASGARPDSLRVQVQHGQEDGALTGKKRDRVGLGPKRLWCLVEEEC
jgi:hypothetical protein